MSKKNRPKDEPISSSENNNAVALEEKKEITEEENNNIKEVNNKAETKEISEKKHENDNKNENKNNNESQYTISDKKSNSMIIVIISCIIAFIVVILLLFSTIFALINNTKSTIISGIHVRNIDLSGLTKEKAIEELNSFFNDNLEKNITLKHNDYEIQISPKQLNVAFNAEDCVNIAFSKGRSGNIFKDNYDILLSLFADTKINPGFSYSEDSLNSLIKEMESNFSDRLIEPSYSIEDSNLIISKGQDGNVIKVDELKTAILYAINNYDENNSLIQVPVEFKHVDSIDLNKVHKEIYHEPKDAYYTTDPYVVYPHVDGVDFAISIDEAYELIKNSTENSVTIPLQFIAPNITTNQIGTEAFPNELATFSTTYASSNVNRSTNIRLASEKINGTVVMPGEVFSYNATVGQRTTANGFKSAAVYSGGEVTTGIGGGICQVSSTLYNAVLLSNLEIVERCNHGFNPGYVPAGRDATVSWGGPDFKFRNTRNYPVIIVCDGSGGSIDIQIFGLYEQVEYEVEIDSHITSWISYSTITRYDPNLSEGESRVIQSGSSGCRAVAYRILKLNGEEVSRELLSQDTYNPHNKIVAIGS